MTTETYEPITRWHIRLAIATISLGCLAVLLGPIVMDESGRGALRTTHALIGVSLVALWLVQGGLGWLLWHDKERIRAFHRTNGYLILGLALLQVPYGLLTFFDFLAHS